MDRICPGNISLMHLIAFGLVRDCFANMRHYTAVT
jgi:hypothetical protein